MDTRWLGPYMIIAHVGKGRYKLLNQESGNTWQRWSTVPALRGIFKGILTKNRRLKRKEKRKYSFQIRQKKVTIRDNFFLKDFVKNGSPWCIICAILRGTECWQFIIIYLFFPSNTIVNHNDEWVEALGLKRSDRTDLLEKRMLNDRIINGAQKLIKKKFALIGGLQDPLLSQLSFDRCTSEGIQIHNTRKIHWITSSSIGGQPIIVYDSLYDDLTESSEKQLAQCYHNCINQAGQLNVEMASFKKQKRYTDCGLLLLQVHMS